MRLRFSILNLILVTMVIALGLAWRVNHHHLTEEIAHLNDELAIRTDYDWEFKQLVLELPNANFDQESKELYVALVKQHEAWRSGLIHYLALDRYRGTIDPAINRTVWWSATINDLKGDSYRVFLADRSHNWYVSDGSAFIVTDSQLKLVAWHGTYLHGEKIHDVELSGNTFPVTMKYIEDSYHNGDSGHCTAEITKSKLIDE